MPFATDRSELPAPPDRSPIAGAAVRQRWLSRPDIAYALPASGALYRFSDTNDVAVDADRLVSRVVPAHDLSADPVLSERALTAQQSAEFAALWKALWASPPVDDGPALLRYRGLFRIVDQRHSDALRDWLREVLAPHHA